MFNGKIHYKWSFSIAMLNYHRVTCLFPSLMNMMISTGLRKRGCNSCHHLYPFLLVAHSSSFFVSRKGHPVLGTKGFTNGFTNLSWNPVGERTFPTGTFWRCIFPTGTLRLGWTTWRIFQFDTL